LAWAIKVTDEYAAWFTTLIKEDLASATQIAQAVAALREEGQRSAVPWSTGSRGQPSTTSRNCALDHAAAPRSGSSSPSIRTVGAAAARRRRGRELAALVPRQHPDRRTAVPRLHDREPGV